MCMESPSDTMSTQAAQEMMRMVLQQMGEAEALLVTTTKVFFGIMTCITAMWSVEHPSWWDHSAEIVNWTPYMSLIQKQV